MSKPQPMNVTFRTRALLAKKVYAVLDNEAESFEEENIGSHLAYLMGGILHGRVAMGVTLEDKGMLQFIHALRTAFPSWNHRVWRFINFCECNSLSRFPDSCQAAIVEGKEPGNLDDEDYPEVGAWVSALKEYASKA